MQIFRRFLILFLPILIILSGIVFWIYQSELEKNGAIIRIRMENRIHSLKKSIDAGFLHIISDLNFLAGLHEANKIFNEGLSDAEAGTFISFSKQRKIYDQIRFLDKTGMEVFRVNYNNGFPVRVSPKDLQFKGERYYFKETFNLYQDEIFFSPLDLNVEQGRLERPFKPMIRIGMPLTGPDGGKSGIIVLNYFADNILRKLDGIAADALKIDAMLLNPEGYWLKNPDPGKEWGFMIPERGGQKIQNLYHEEWKQITGNDQGQFLTQRGLFTFATIYMVMDHVYLTRDFDNYWKIVLFVASDDYHAGPRNFLSRLLMFYIALLLVLGVGAFILSLNRHIKMLAEENIKKLNVSYERFVPEQFLSQLDKKDITEIRISDYIDRELTILFSDIRSYTKISESLAAEEIFLLLNEYFEQIGPAIRNNSGFIDKFIGDAVMALFPGKADDALAAAVGMKRNLDLFNQARKKEEKIPIEAGYGLHRGVVSLGTVGTTDRMETTVIGDNVNLASRIESLTKSFKTSVIVSDSVYNSLTSPENFRLREIDTVRVKGKTIPIVIYECFDCDPEEVIKKKTEHLPIFSGALMHYKKGDFDQALEDFKQYQKLCPEDGITKIYITRCSTLKRVPPGPDWKGISTL